MNTIKTASQICKDGITAGKKFKQIAMEGVAVGIYINQVAFYKMKKEFAQHAQIEMLKAKVAELEAEASK